MRVSKPLHAILRRGLAFMCLWIGFSAVASSLGIAAQMPSELQGYYDYFGHDCNPGFISVEKDLIAGFIEGSGTCQARKIRRNPKEWTWKGSFRCFYEGHEWNSTLLLSLQESAEPPLLVIVFDLSGRWASNQSVFVAKQCKK